LNTRIGVSVTVARMALVLAFLTIGMTPVRAQDARRPTVTKAFDLFQPYPSTVPVGTSVVFRPVAGSTRAQTIVRGGLQVRVFSLRDDEDRPSRLAIKDGCEVYVSVVHRLSLTPTGEARFQTVDHTWLTLSNTLSSVRPGRYFLIFEQLGGEEQHFRIREGADASQYFASGFLLQVQPDASIDPARVREEYLKRRNQLGRLYEEADRSDAGRPCYRYQPVRAHRDDEQMQLAEGELVPCTVDGDSNASASDEGARGEAGLLAATPAPASVGGSAPGPSPTVAFPA
jgi:hypothetical protein